jgi:hypothetical protein
MTRPVRLLFPQSSLLTTSTGLTVSFFQNYRLETTRNDTAIPAICSLGSERGLNCAAKTLGDMAQIYLIGLSHVSLTETCTPQCIYAINQKICGMYADEGLIIVAALGRFMSISWGEMRRT